MRLASYRTAATLLTGLATAFACTSASAEPPANEPVVVLILDDEEAVEEVEEALLDHAYEYDLGPESAVRLNDLAHLLGSENRDGGGRGLVQPAVNGLLRDLDYPDDGYWDMDMSLTAGEAVGGALLIIDRRSGTITLRASLSPGACDIAIPLFAALESLRSHQPGEAIVLTGDDGIEIFEGRRLREPMGDGSVRLTADSCLGDGSVRFLRSPGAEFLR